MAKRKLHPFVEVLWNDAWADPTEEVTIDKGYERNMPVAYRTRGWLIADDEDGVLLAPEENLDDEGTYRGPMQIPRGMVVSTTELVVRKKGVQKKRVFIKNEQAPKLNTEPSHDGARSAVMPNPVNATEESSK